MTATRFTIFGALAASLLMVPACDDKKADGKPAAEATAKTDPEAKSGAKDAKADEKTPEDNAAVAGDAKPDEAKPADLDAGAEAAGGAAEDSIGVPVCDEYIEKYGACIEAHAPEASRKQAAELLAKSADRFRKQSVGPEKDSLAQSCKAALDAVKKTTKGWDCTYE
ncbi:MAG: hypothetical protein ACRBN8_17475 [Nannocystales bacterium]